MSLGRTIDQTLRSTTIPNWMYLGFGVSCILVSAVLYYLSHEFVPQKQFSDDSNAQKIVIAALTQKLSDLELNQRALLTEQLHCKESLNHVEDKTDRMIQILLENRKIAAQTNVNGSSKMPVYRCEYLIPQNL